MNGINVRGLTKSYRGQKVVDDLTFDVHPGTVTGFLGPNGAGKTTTMRMLVGLVRPDAGTALLAGRPYHHHPAPLRAVGALLDPGWAHPQRTARAHLDWLARSNGLPKDRVDAVLLMVGLSTAGDRRIGALSLGMRQRLGIAAAMLGNPEVLILDEPANGLDPQGIAWMRGLLRDLAADGRTVLVSSHLLAETALLADNLVIIGRGRLLQQCTTAEFTSLQQTHVLVRAKDQELLATVIAEAGGTIDADPDHRPVDPDIRLVSGLSAEEIAHTALHAGLVLHELTPRRRTVEEEYLRLTADSVEHHSRPPALRPEKSPEQ
ncbi:ATP-binding cassette domain-containing protein [Streptomyces xanthochromogenes]|uniref:ABC transporter ATP-binding protein n=1 Tax=Streptomyces xanthochromogenes TaxID=67384 RepID=UPI00342ACBFF